MPRLCPPRSKRKGGAPIFHASVVGQRHEATTTTTLYAAVLDLRLPPQLLRRRTGIGTVVVMRARAWSVLLRASHPKLASGCGRTDVRHRRQCGWEGHQRRQLPPRASACEGEDAFSNSYTQPRARWKVGIAGRCARRRSDAAECVCAHNNQRTLRHCTMLSGMTRRRRRRSILLLRRTPPSG